jgi:hypothetical protein
MRGASGGEANQRQRTGKSQAVANRISKLLIQDHFTLLTPLPARLAAVQTNNAPRCYKLNAAGGAKVRPRFVRFITASRDIL